MISMVGSTIGAECLTTGPPFYFVVVKEGSLAGKTLDLAAGCCTLLALQ
jgi:hypothetical protein